ncbi:MAG: glycosyl hydrolase family 18 protein [Chloroflexota bacterium]
MSFPARRPDPRHAGSARSRLVALLAGLVLLVGVAPVADAHPVRPDAASSVGLRPTIQYEESMAHAGDKTVFAPGTRVTVPFKPRRSDQWAVGGARPQALPAGRLSGQALRQATHRPASVPHPAVRGAAPAIGAVDEPYLDPSTAVQADLAAAVDAGGLKREVFGFLPYWELSVSSTRLDWEKLSTIAYFGVGATANGDLQKTNSDGSTSVGWSGWTSAKVTGVIDAAHASGARVVLTVQSFAWSSAGVTRQKALLGSSTHRANLARQIAAAVRDRGADGVNLDFEPIVSTYSDEFTALVRSVRAELNGFSRGYQLTFDATGWIGNYPIEAATSAGAADAVIVMGYDYRTGGSKAVGSVAPLGGPSYDITDTIRSFVSRVPASKVILGVPYYGRAWSTSGSAFGASNISGVENGASTTVVYSTARQYAVDHGRHWDPVEAVAWTAYRRQNCTATYGCVNPWRQLYYDDAQALGLKYDAVNRYDLRGAGIWALGYDGTRTELYGALKAKFITDKVPPVITATTISPTVISPNGDGRMDIATMRVSVTGHLRYGWVVRSFVDGSPGSSLRSGSYAGKNVVYTWDGRTATGALARDGAYQITLWMADASDNRASVSRVVTVDRRPAGVGVSAASSFISPDGDRHSDTTALTMKADEPITGAARIFDKNGATVRRWTFSRATAASWAWDGRNAAGTTVGDGRYTFRVKGLDRAGNATTRDITLRVDRTIKSVTWAHGSFIPRAGATDRLSFAFRRPATVSVSIYGGSTLIRRIWTNHPTAAVTYAWTWNGKTATGALVRPGTYRAVVEATSSIGPSRFTRNVTVR